MKRDNFASNGQIDILPYEGKSMKYRVTGTNHSTGARMTLEFEGESKAAAERKARNAGMDVQHIEDITDGEHPHQERKTHRGEHAGGGGIELMPKLIAAIVILAVIVYFFGPKIRALLHLQHR